MADFSKLENRVASFDLYAEITTLLADIGTNRVEPVAYDTAWLARLGHVAPDLASQAIDWLRAHQLPDGSWGAAMPVYYHDRVISTLAAMIALACNNAPEDQPRIKVALPALQHSLAHLEKDIAGRTIGFEMLLPALVADARTLGLDVHDPDNLVERMSVMRDAKLQHAPAGLIDRSTTLGFSAEMVGRAGRHLLDLNNLQQADGSVSISPAATAFYLTLVGEEPNALRYLRTIVQDGGAPAITAIDIFERAWALWNFTRGHTIDAVTANHLDALLHGIEAKWDRNKGIAHASTFAVHDGDDTGLVYELLAQFGRAPDPVALWYYEEDSHFRCFDLENHVSVSTNIHILGALRAAGFAADHRAVQKIVEFLRREESPTHFWVDKWHASPYYPTGHAVVIAAGYLDDLVCNAVTWLLESQNDDGSWGYYAATAEETAYCLQALMCWQQHGHLVPADVLLRGITWLIQNSEPPYTPLWISKTLKCPTLVVRSAILGVLQQYTAELCAV